MLKLMLDGWTPKKDYQFVNSGAVIVNKDNLDTYAATVRENAAVIVGELKTRYLAPPAK